MKDLLDEANKRDNERNIGVFTTITIQEVLVITICNN